MLCRESTPFDNDWPEECDEGCGEETKGEEGGSGYMVEAFRVVL